MERHASGELSPREARPSRGSPVQLPASATAGTGCAGGFPTGGPGDPGIQPAGRAFFLSPFSSGAPATCPTLFLHGPLEAGSQRRKLRHGAARLGFPRARSSAGLRLLLRQPPTPRAPQDELSRESSSPRSLTERRASAQLCACAVGSRGSLGGAPSAGT